MLSRLAGIEAHSTGNSWHIVVSIVRDGMTSGILVLQCASIPLDL